MGSDDQQGLRARCRDQRVWTWSRTERVLRFEKEQLLEEVQLMCLCGLFVTSLGLSNMLWDSTGNAVYL